jgi:hypothetical protein
MAKTLVKHGVDLSLRDSRDRTVLDINPSIVSKKLYRYSRYVRGLLFRVCVTVLHLHRCDVEHCHDLGSIL